MTGGWLLHAQDSPCGPNLRCTTIDPERFTWVRDLAGGSSHDATMAGHFPDLIADVSPDVPYHFHLDMALGNALRVVLRGTAEPVVIRVTRFVTLAACDTPTCSGARGLIWIDTLKGIEIGGIEFAPSNGEPTPTLTLFSKQVQDPVTRRAQLPADFIEDLATWARRSRSRGPAARYFVNGQGLKTVVAHDEDNCHGADQSSLEGTLCRSQNMDAADQDLAAAYYLLFNSFAEGSTMRAALKTDEDKWVADRRTSCGAGADGPTLACRLKTTRDRVTALTDLYLKAGKGSGD